MLPTELGPFCKLVLAARGSQLSSYGQVLGLFRPLLGELLRYCDREGGGDAPDLEESCQYLPTRNMSRSFGGGRAETYQCVDRCCADVVDELDHQLHDEYEDQ